MKNLIIFLLLLIVTSNKSFSQIKILFDATKAETAGSADWVIDADLNNLNWTKFSTVTTSGSKANAQQLPSPDQSTITANTTESYWTGALSSWGIDCVNKGYRVESLPYNGKITYGDNTNVQDLSNYKVYIIPEPNIYFKSAEKIAILNFVKNGGGLFIISDHAGADRNNDGSDSPAIWNDLFNNNGMVNNPFGIKFDTTNPNGNKYPGDFSETTTNFTTSANPITKGLFGTSTKLKFSDGTSMALDTTANSTVKGVVFAKESTNKLNGAMLVYARYGKGKIVAIGDSSPCDDGTGGSSYSGSLYVSYSNDPAVGDNHRNLFMNSTIWLATTDTIVPIKFINSTVKAYNQRTAISWQVNQSECQNVNFEIESSSNGTDFSVIGNVAGNCNGISSIVNYQWESQAMATSTTYYRIKAIENGNLYYSKVAALFENRNPLIRFYPNPFSLGNSKNITIKGVSEGGSITISDLSGKIYFQTISKSPSVVCEGLNNKLAAGLYILSIKNDENLYTEKIMVLK